MQTKSVELITNCLICREPSHQQPEPPLRTRRGGEADKLSRAQQGDGAIWDNLQEKWDRNMYGIIIFKLCLDGRFRLLLIFSLNLRFRTVSSCCSLSPQCSSCLVSVIVDVNARCTKILSTIIIQGVDTDQD